MTTLHKDEHIRVIRRFTTRAQEEFETGDQLLAAELLWGAFAHGVILVAILNEWEYNGHAALREAASRLTELYGGRDWRSDFGTAGNLHIHFYHGRLNNRLLQQCRTTTEKATNRLLEIVEEQI